MRPMWTYNHEAQYLSKGVIRSSSLGPKGFKDPARFKETP